MKIKYVLSYIINCDNIAPITNIYYLTFSKSDNYDNIKSVINKFIKLKNFKYL